MTRLVPSPRGAPSRLALGAFLGLLALPLLLMPIVLFDLQRAMLRPLVMSFGRPAAAVVSAKNRFADRRARGSYVELNYLYSADYAPRIMVRVSDAAFDAIPAHGRVAIHHLPGCPSCVALDDDHGSARGQALAALAFLVLAAGGGALAARRLRFSR